MPITDGDEHTKLHDLSSVTDHSGVLPTTSLPIGTPSGGIDIGDANDQGVATDLALSDHQHALPAPGAGYPVNTGFDAEADGTATTPARSDHKHTIIVTPGNPSSIEIGDAASAGSATGASKHDHQHQLTAPTDPVASNFGDTTAVGVGTAPSRQDHRHSREANPVTAHEAAGDPHTGYQKESEKGAALGYASLDAATVVPTAQLGSGTADSSTFLRGDSTWASPGASSTNIKETELDWGTALYQKQKKFTVTDGDVSAASQLLMQKSFEAPTGRGQDENEMEEHLCRCVAGSGSFDVYIDSPYGSSSGIYKYNYLIG